MTDCPRRQCKRAAQRNRPLQPDAAPNSFTSHIVRSTSNLVETSHPAPTHPSTIDPSTGQTHRICTLATRVDVNEAERSAMADSGEADGVELQRAETRLKRGEWDRNMSTLDSCRGTR